MARYSEELMEQMVRMMYVSFMRSSFSSRFAFWDYCCGRCQFLIDKQNRGELCR